MKNIHNKNIVVGITGSIAAYKAADLVSKLKKAGANIKVVMTKSSTSFITERTLESISNNKVLVDENENDESFLHLDIAKWADIFLIAPCTANSFNKITSGLADDLLSTSCLAFKGKILIAPAMNPDMWNNEIVQKNRENMSKHKFKIIGPDYGLHACGDEGYGRMSSPEAILESLSNEVEKNELDGIRILVSAGPTREPIDPVRFISNYSSGKMGYALAESARNLGADVELISGPVCIKMPENIKITSVETSGEMLDTVLGKIPYCDVFISAAAISDYRPSHKLTEKHKSSDGELVIRLERGEDILKLAKETKAGLYAVGFSAETNNISDNAKIKLEKKNIDMIISNEANHQKGLGFESDMNEVCIIEKDSMLKIPKNTKRIIADIILSRIAKNIKGNLIKIKNAR